MTGNSLSYYRLIAVSQGLQSLNPTPFWWGGEGHWDEVAIIIWDSSEQSPFSCQSMIWTWSNWVQIQKQIIVMRNNIILIVPSQLDSK